MGKGTVSVTVADILADTGLPFAPVAFGNPPQETYAVYTQEVNRGGADLLNCMATSDVTIEVYAYDFYDEEAVRAVSKALDRRAIAYRLYDATFIHGERLYCTRFEFELICKDSLSDFHNGEWTY